MIDLEASSDLARILPCVAGGETFCFDAEAVQAVEGAENLQRNPGPGQPHGWLLSRSDEIEVYSLAELLGLKPPERGTSHKFVVVIDSQPTAFGLAVDQVLEQRPTGATDRLPLPAWVQNQRAGFFNGAVRHEDSLCLLLTPDRLHPETLPFLPEPSPPLVRRAAIETSNPSQIFLFSGAGSATGVTPSAEGQVIYGLSSRQVVEVHPMPPVIPVPTSPPFLCGLTNYRGEAVPVVDLDRFLGPEVSEPLAQDQLAQSQLLVVRASGAAGRLAPGPSWIGFPIARQIRVVELPLACHPVEPDASRADRVRGIFTIENLTLIVPDVDAIPAIA